MQCFGSKSKLPVTGILRPRKRYGTVRGFTVVDPGGNWLRISRMGDSEQQESDAQEDGLAHIVSVAARLGDSTAHGGAIVAGAPTVLVG